MRKIRSELFYLSVYQLIWMTRTTLPIEIWGVFFYEKTSMEFLAIPLFIVDTSYNFESTIFFYVNKLIIF